MGEFFHKNIDVVQKNAEPARGYYVPFGSLEQISTDNREKSDRFLNLSGQWSFKYYDCPEDVPESVFEPEYVISPLKKVEVPSCLETPLGEDFYNGKTPFPFDPPFVPDENPTGVFLREVDVTKISEFQQQYICFEGVGGNFYVYINGQFAGYSVSTGSIVEFNVTSYLKKGNNRVAVMIVKYGADSYLDMKDGWNFSGIVKEVYMLGRPNAHIKDFFVSSFVDAGYRDAKINLSVDCICPEAVSATLFGADGKRLETKNLDSQSEISFMVNYPALWSAETPDLYTVVIEACGEFVYHRLGLRYITFEDGVFRINGRRVTLKGVFRDELESKKGCSLGMVDMQRDIIALKSNNINAVMGNGEIFDPRFYQLCDRFGLYVADTLPLNVTATELGKEYDLSAQYKISSAVKRNRNFTSVVMNCVKREYKSDDFSVCECVKECDGTRPLVELYNNGNDTYRVINGKRFKDCENALLQEENKGVVALNCSSSDGNSFGGISEYFSLFDNPRFVGMFAGNWTSPVLEKKINGQVVTVENGGDCDGLLDKNLNPHLALAQLKQLYRPFDITPFDIEKGDFAITNLYDSLYFSRLECIYEITRYGKVVSGGTIGAIPLAPQKAEKIHIDYEIPDGETFIRFIFRMLGDCSYASDGDIVGYKQFPLGNRPVKATPKTSGTVSCSENEKQIIVTGENFKYTFSKFSGTVAQMVRDNKTLFTAPVEYNIWSIPNGNDKKTVQLWKKYVLDNPVVKVYDVSCNAVGETVIIKFNLSIGSKGMAPFINCDALYSVDATGVVSLKCITSVDEDIPYLPRFGLKFPLSGDLTWEYYGQGPYANYRDCESASYMGHFSSSNSVTESYSKPQECSNRFAKLCGFYDKARFGLLLFEKDGFDFSPTLQGGNTLLSVDYKKSGLGFSKDFPPEDYATLCEKNFVFSIKFCPISQKDKSLLEFLVDDCCENVE